MRDLQTKKSDAEIERYFSKIYRKPYKMAIKLYTTVLSLSLLGIVASYFIPYNFDCVQNSNWVDLLKNISIGCFTSILVSAWIENGNIRDNNDKNNKMYREIYVDLQSSIRSYLKSWAKIYYMIFREKDVETKNIHGLNGIM